MIPLIIGIISGGIVSWFITRYYYRRSNQDQRRLFSKLPEELRKVLREDKREKLTVKELNELVKSKTIDKERRGLEAYKACPKCGSTNIGIGSDVDVDYDYKPSEGEMISAARFKIVECPDCGWRKDEMDDISA